MRTLMRYLISIPVFVMAIIQMIEPVTAGQEYAIAPLLAMGIASAAVKGVTGIAQMMKRRPEEVEYNIPNEVFQSLDMARARAQGTNPMFDTRRENLESQSAVLSQRLTEGGGGVKDIARLQAGMMAGTRDIDMAEEQYQLAQEAQYSRELANMAQYKDRAFEINELQPNEREWNEYYNAKKAGAKNLMGAMDSVVGMVGSGIGAQGINGALDDALKTGGGEGTIPESVVDFKDTGDYEFDMPDPELDDFNYTAPDPWTPADNEMAYLNTGPWS